MADYYCTSRPPLAGSFFSANHHTANLVPPGTIGGQRSCLSPVLHLDGQMETFCVQVNTLLIRPSTARERAQLIKTSKALSVRLETMKNVLDTQLCCT